MPQKNRIDSSDYKSGAPEIDPSLIDAKRKAEIDEAFTVERDADVVTELPDDSAETEVPTVDDDSAEKLQEVDKTAAEPGRFKRIMQSYWRHKLWTVPLTVAVLAGLILALPITRYPALALFMKQDIIMTVLDESTQQPVSSAVVELDGQKAMTDTKGAVTIRARVGDREARVSKRYYQESVSTVFVPLSSKYTQRELRIKATGRQVPLAVVNKLSGKPVENVTLKAAGTEVKTDKDGKATLVLPADKSEQAVELSADTFNSLKTTLVVTEVVSPKNSFQITPAGKVYFLSKQSGKIDVVKTDLDGSNRQTIVAGTGREEEGNTVLLASRDWKNLALLSRRDNGKPKLYLITTTDDKMAVMDEGSAAFGPIGWSDDTFVYSVNRTDRKEWQAGRTALKSYKVAGAKLTTLDETAAEGDQSNYKYSGFQGVSLLGDKLVYNVHWFSSGYWSTVEGMNLAIRTVAVSGQGKKDLKTFPAGKHYLYEPRLYEPGELYFMYTTQGKPDSYEFLEYENGVVKATTGDQEAYFNKAYPTYLESPDSKRTFWSESRDGKETFFTGTATGEEPKQVAVLPEHQVYGWYTNDYLLASKKGSELFILPADGSKATKVTDYHKPQYSFRGYGGGYGGL